MAPRPISSDRVVHAELSLDGDDVVGARERDRRRLARSTGPADRREEVLEAGRRDHPEHHELVGPLVDDLVLDVVAEQASRAGYQRMTLTVDHHASAAPKADLQLDLVAVRVL